MSPKVRFQVGTGLLAVGIVLIIVALLGMTGITRKLAPSSELVIPALLFTAVGGALRRRGRREM